MRVSPSDGRHRPPGWALTRPLAHAPCTEQVKEAEQESAKLEAVFPCTLRIMPTCVFNKKDPIVLGVEVAEGIAKAGHPARSLPHAPSIPG